MTVDIEVPDLVAFAGDVSSGDEQAAGQVDRATITDIYLEEGDLIEEGELFAVIENSYGSCRILAPATGLLIEVPVEEGEVVSSEAVLATINTDL